MKIIKVYRAFFSPSETTKKVVNGIAKSFSDCPSQEIDLTRFDVRQNSYDFHEDELLIIGVPAYAGRIPAPVVDALSRFQGKNTPVVLVATYGNKALDDTLMELYMNVKDRGFVTAGISVFSCQHTFLRELAQGRPDADDMAVARQFGDKLKERLAGLDAPCAIDPKKVPGSYPYQKPPMGIFPFEVKTNEYCIYCMLCVDACPVQAINEANPFTIDGTKCIRCGSCIRVCPAQAKSFTEEPFKKLQGVLEGFTNQHHEPWFTIA